MQSELIDALEQWQQDPSGRRVVYIQIGSQFDRNYEGFTVCEFPTGIIGTVRNIADLDRYNEMINKKIKELQKNC